MLASPTSGRAAARGWRRDQIGRAAGAAAAVAAAADSHRRFVGAVVGRRIRVVAWGNRCTALACGFEGSQWLGNPLGRRTAGRTRGFDSWQASGTVATVRGTAAAVVAAAVAAAIVVAGRIVECIP